MESEGLPEIRQRQSRPHTSYSSPVPRPSVLVLLLLLLTFLCFSLWPLRFASAPPRRRLTTTQGRLFIRSSLQKVKVRVQRSSEGASERVGFFFDWEEGRKEGRRERKEEERQSLFK